jgi:Flp pilus assembly pilin Flp
MAARPQSLQLGQGDCGEQFPPSADSGSQRNTADFPRGRSMKIREAISGVRRASRGQTMTEYALILATVAVIVISLYNTAGTILTELIGKVGPYLLGG